jgi:hypothetical protein
MCKGVISCNNTSSNKVFTDFFPLLCGTHRPNLFFLVPFGERLLFFGHLVGCFFTDIFLAVFGRQLPDFGGIFIKIFM